MENYIPKARIKQIGATSRASVKIANNFYTFESSIVKEFPSNIDENEIDMIKEWDAVWDTVNGEVDNQINETQNSYDNARRGEK